jgi:ferredoxin like protein
MPNQQDSTEQKLYLAKYRLDDRPHIVVTDQDVCRHCEQINGTPQPCMILCPANVFKWEESKGAMENIVSYDNCVECGACRIIYPYGNIEWKYPRWGRGYHLRFG